MAAIKSLVNATDPEQPLKYRYEAIIDYMFSNPQAKLGEIAEMIGCTQPWLSQIVNSDGFQARYAQRRMTFGQEQERVLSSKLYDMADRASERVLVELDKGEECDANFALDAATRALRAIGFGAPSSAGPAAQQPAVQQQADGVNANTLALARQAIASHSVVMTRVTESVEVSTGAGVEGSGSDGSRPSVEKAVTLEGQKEEGSGL